MPFAVVDGHVVDTLLQSAGHELVVSPLSQTWLPHDAGDELV
ncbi:MAG: hypothetical protein AAB633_00705 [Patescibacteria group bacterium]